MDRALIYNIIQSKDTKNPYTEDQMALAVDEVEQAIINYCCISEVPDALRFTVVNMSIDLLKHDIRMNADSDNVELDPSRVVLLKEGDTTIQLSKSSGNDQSSDRVNNILLNHTAQLNRFRRIW